MDNELSDLDISVIIQDAIKGQAQTASWHEFARLVLHFDKDREALGRLKEKWSHQVTKLVREGELRDKVDAARYYKGGEA